MISTFHISVLLKMDVPRVSIVIASTSIDINNSTDSKNDVQYLKTVCTYEDQNESDPSKAQQLHK